MMYPIPLPASEVGATAQRRRVLLLSYRLPPTYSTSIASRRTEGLYRYLHQYGWEPVVVTTQNKTGLPGVVAVDNRSYAGRMEREGRLDPSALPAAGRRPMGKAVGVARNAVKYGLRLVPRYFDSYAAWSSAASQAAVRYGQQHKVDLVWATLSPLSLGFAAVSAAARLRVPCVLDLRDPPEDHFFGPRFWLRQALRRAAAVTVASGTCITPFLTANAAGSPLLILSGSWHPEAIAPEPSPQFKIVFAGSWHPEFEGETLLAALTQLAGELPGFARDCRAVFAGKGSAFVRNTQNFAAAEALIELRRLMPYDEMQHLLRQASVLLIVRPNAYKPDAVGGKLFDYVAFQTPVLSTGGKYEPHGRLVDWIGGSLFSNDAAAITDFLRVQYLRWRAEGTTRVTRNPDALAYLGHARMAAEFASVFDAVVEARRPLLREVEPWA